MKNITQESIVTLVELPPTQFGIYNGDPGHDVYTRFWLPSRALHALAAILIRDGWKDVQIINPLYHGKKRKLTAENKKRIFNSDILCVSAITRTSPQTIELVRRYKSVNHEGIVIAGGFDPTFRAEEWINRGADFVVIGEAEITFSELTNRLAQTSRNFSDIDGLAFKEGNSITFTPKRRLLTSEELGQLPLPYYDNKTKAYTRTAVIETARGCPNACNFCTVTQFYGRRYREKPIDYVIQSMKAIKNMGSLIFFTDDNFAANPKRTIELCERISKEGLYRRKNIAQVTVRAAENPELLRALKKAGIEILCVGIESLNDETLKGYCKPYSAQQNKENIQKLRKAGFWIHGMMIVGGDGDTLKSLREDFEWMKKNLDSIQIFSPTPFPGSEFFKKMEDEGRIITKDFSLYDDQNVVVKPKNFSPFELQRIIYEFYKEFYSFKESFRRFKTSPLKEVALGVYLYNHVVGGLKNAIHSPQAVQYLKFLKSIS